MKYSLKYYIQSDERDFKRLAGKLLAASDDDINKLLERDDFLEVKYDEQD